MYVINKIKIIYRNDFYTTEQVWGIYLQDTGVCQLIIPLYNNNVKSTLTELYNLINGTLLTLGIKTEMLPENSVVSDQALRI